jgi:hypothetical protein
MSQGKEGIKKIETERPVGYCKSLSMQGTETADQKNAPLILRGRKLC